MAYDLDREPGSFATRRAESDFRVALVFLILVLLAGVLALATVATGTAALVTSLALVAVALAGRTFFDFRFEDGLRWGKGGSGEAAVGTELEKLRSEEGYVVMHDLDKVVPGNVDHLVCGPTGVFMIDTKFRRYVDPDIPKARKTALTLARELRAPWVQPVICFATRSYEPRNVKGVVIVGREQLVSYIRAQKNQAVPFDCVAAFADRQ